MESFWGIVNCLGKNEKRQFHQKLDFWKFLKKFNWIIIIFNFNFNLKWLEKTDKVLSTTELNTINKMKEIVWRDTQGKIKQDFKLKNWKDKESMIHLLIRKVRQRSQRLHQLWPIKIKTREKWQRWWKRWLLERIVKEEWLIVQIMIHLMTKKLLN